VHSLALPFLVRIQRFDWRISNAGAFALAADLMVRPSKQFPDDYRPRKQSQAIKTVSAAFFGRRDVFTSQPEISVDLPFQMRGPRLLRGHE
jgi:hypothetical protein